LLVENRNNTYHKINQETSRDELERYFSSQVQAEFVSMAGHEMKTSIQAILTYAELLQDKHDRHREDYAKAILRNASRLRMLSNNLTDFTKIDLDMLRLKKERFDLGTLISSLVEDFRNMNRYHEAKIKIAVHYQKQVYVNADSERLAQVILNLLDNATKFTKNGDISIKLESQEDNYLLVAITDTGPGIDKNVKPNLFTKFATSSHSGTGLGLYICKNIIEAHGGRIWAENNSDKSGATFSFKIPINRDNSNTNYTKFLNSRIEV